MKFVGTIIDNKMTFNTKADEWKWIKHLEKMEGKPFVLELSAKKKYRSDNQNKYYWGVIIPIIQEYTGYTKDEVHDFLKVKFLTDKSGKIPRIKSTSDLSTIEFERYWIAIAQYFGQEHGVEIPFPEDPFLEQLLVEYDNKSL